MVSSVQFCVVFEYCCDVIDIPVVFCECFICVQGLQVGQFVFVFANQCCQLLYGIGSFCSCSLAPIVLIEGSVGGLDRCLGVYAVFFGHSG